MNWNEKIALVKQQFSDDEFSVPLIKRKEILRKIETQFITRPQNYYDLNHSPSPFSNWWNGIGVPIVQKDKSDHNSTLDFYLTTNERYWIACEFYHGIEIYKSNLEAVRYLISISQGMTKTFHIVQLKYKYMISLKFDDRQVSIKLAGKVRL